MAVSPASINPNVLSDRKNAADGGDAVAYGLCLKDPEIFQQYRMGEYLGHTLAYLPLKTGEHVKVYMAEIRQELSHVVYRLEVNHPGLIGYILLPREFPKSLGNKIDVKIIFQGTDVTHWDSLKRDFIEQGGAGNESFHANQDTMLLQTHQIIKNFKQQLSQQGIKLADLELSLTIAGHSLGAADAQRFLFAIKKTIAQNWDCPTISSSIAPINREEFNHFTKLRLFTFNSTGVSNEDNQAAEAASGWITDQIKQSNGKKKLETEINIFYAAGDGIQQTGYTHLLHRASKEQVLIRFIKASNNKEGQHFMTAQEAMRIFLNETRKQLAIQGMKNAAFIGAAGVLAMAFQLPAWATMLGLVGSAASRYKDWYDIATVAYSLGAGFAGTLATHRAHYFQNKFEDLENRHLDHTLTLWTNERPEEHQHIKDQVGLKSPVANLAQQGFSFGHSVICRRNKKEKMESHSQKSGQNYHGQNHHGLNGHNRSLSESAAYSPSSANAANTAITWKLDSDNLRQHQTEVANAKAQAIASAREAQRQKDLNTALQTFL
jgi:hypothetical protein